MKKSRFSKEQIIDALRLADRAKPAVDMCRQIGVSEGHVLQWKENYADLGVS